MRKFIKRSLWTLAIVFILLNVLAAVHAWKFTHFSDSAETKSTLHDNALVLAITGVSNPRPVNTTFPSQPYESFVIDGDYPTDCWFIKADSSRGTVVVCHGYGGCKSSMLNIADAFLAMHYSVLLPDFMGCGDSPGTTCTVGFYEADQVKNCYEYLTAHGEQNVILFGTSMGAVAIMRAVTDSTIAPSSVILECPFGTLYNTVCSRFRMMNFPSFPMAGLLTFWGGAENDFWAFSHEPEKYAKSIKCPTLLMYGEKDPKVSRTEIDLIYENIPSPKQLVTFPDAGHENYLRKYPAEWTAAVQNFLAR